MMRTTSLTSALQPLALASSQRSRAREARPGASPTLDPSAWWKQKVGPGDGATIAFRLTPDRGHRIDRIGGDCGGGLAGGVYTTDPVSSDCSIDVSFAIERDDVIFQDGFDGP